MHRETTIAKRRSGVAVGSGAPGRRGGWFALALVLTLAAPTRLAAQGERARGTWFPAQRYFAPLIADPRQIRLAAGFAVTDLFEPGRPQRERPPFDFPVPEEMRSDLQGTVALGGTIPLWGTAGAGGGVTVGAQAGVFARFRLEVPSRDYVASDWLVALPVELARGRFSARARLLHQSSHLGDELIFDTGARRIEFGHEAIDLLAAYTFTDGPRIYGGGAWIWRSNTENEPLLRPLEIQDDWALHAGADGTWYPWAAGRAGVVAGVDWQGAQRADWRSQLSALAGLAARGPGGALRLALRFFTGPSPLGEFFLTDETFWGLEVTATR